MKIITKILLTRNLSILYVARVLKLSFHFIFLSNKTVVPEFNHKFPCCWSMIIPWSLWLYLSFKIKLRPEYVTIWHMHQIKSVREVQGRNLSSKTVPWEWLFKFSDIPRLLQRKLNNKTMKVREKWLSSMLVQIPAKQNAN